MIEKQPVCVLSEGAWGTAIASVLAHNGYPVRLWCHEPEVAQSIATTRINQRYAPDIELDPAITPFTNIHEAVDGVRTIWCAVPVAYTRSVLEQLRGHLHEDTLMIMLNKGIEQDTLLVPTDLAADVLGADIVPIVVSGPSFAHDVMRKALTAIVVASDDNYCADMVQRMLENEYIVVTQSTDVWGVQVGGALKNGIAVGIGILEGAGYSDNTKIILFTRGLAEMRQLAELFGGTADTLFGLAGVGDLALTALGGHSKNLSAGRRLGKGETLETLKSELSTLPEGINTIASVNALAEQYHCQLPIFSAIHAVVFEGKPVQLLVDALRQ